MVQEKRRWGKKSRGDWGALSSSLAEVQAPKDGDLEDPVSWWGKDDRKR